jgi:hypothetical protein
MEVNEHNLTGVWHGLYSYPIARAPVLFVATLIDAGSAISGTTHEPCAMGGSPSQILYAMVSGSHQDRAVSFVKTYNWSGTFLMIRSSGQAEAVGRQVFERA